MVVNFSRHCILIFLLTSSTTGCVFSKLGKDLDKLAGISHLFAGTVSTEETETHAIVVVALEDVEGKSITAFRMMSETGAFEIRSKAVPTFFFGFADLNDDLRFQAEEPHAWAERGQALDPATGNTEAIRLTIDSANHPPAYPEHLVDEPLEDHLNNYGEFNLGTVSSLGNWLFSPEQSSRGLWEPFAFIEDGGTGIHFMEPYDPQRTPILFVHGINGTPRNFTAMIEQMDTSEYQAWVLSYPSGLHLSWVARGLYQFMDALHRKHRFRNLHLVAHSMGGLVSRGTVNLCTQNHTCGYLRSYTTLSTPWGGVASVQSGLEWAPTVVPVWWDLDPDSEYVTTLFDTPLPDELPYHLMFGFRQDSIFGMGSSDGVIQVSSQLRSEAQDQSRTLRGYDEDHVSILRSERVIGKLYENLSAPKH